MAILCGMPLSSSMPAPMFPGTMPGVDLIVPDLYWRTPRPGQVQALVLTHGHRDTHRRGPWSCRSVSGPVYGTRLALTSISKLEEHGVGRHCPGIDNVAARRAIGLRSGRSRWSPVRRHAQHARLRRGGRSPHAAAVCCSTPATSDRPDTAGRPSTCPASRSSAPRECSRSSADGANEGLAMRREVQDAFEECLTATGTARGRDVLLELAPAAIPGRSGDRVRSQGRLHGT